MTFGLVSVPIRVHSATEDRTVHFHQVHAKDGARIEQHRICSAEHREVPYEEVAKGYEVREGEYVLLSKDEIAAAAGENAHRIGLEAFVCGADVAPEHYDRTYYLGVGDDGESAYRLLHDGLVSSERVGIGRWVFHNREYLVAVRPLGGILALHTMRFAAELVDPGEIDVSDPSRAPSEREIDMAGRLVDSLQGAFEATAYHDEYRERVLDLIARKAKGESPEPAQAPEPERQDDLLAALEASLDRHGGRARRGRGDTGRRQASESSGSRAHRRSRSEH